MKNITIWLLAFVLSHPVFSFGRTVRIPGPGGVATGTPTFIWTAKTCANQTGTGVTSSTCTPSSSFSSGELMACYVSYYNNVGPFTFSVTDSNSDTFTAYGSTLPMPNVASGLAQLFYFTASTTITSVTVNISGTVDFADILCDSATGASGATDSGPVNGTVTSGGTISTSTLTTTVNGDGIFCGAQATGSGTFTVGMPWVQGATADSHDLNQLWVQSAAGGVTATIALDVGGGYLLCGAFKP